MATSYDRIFAAAVALMGDVNAAATGTVLLAPTNYGLDFRITPGSAVYQVRLSTMVSIGDANSTYPRVIVTVLIHHYVLKNDSLVDEKKFLHNMMNHVADHLMVQSKWQAEAGIYAFPDGIDPEMSDGERVGNVISFEVNAAVLATAV